MTAPVPEESNEAIDVTETHADEHGSDLPDEADTPQVDKPQGPLDPSGPGGQHRQPPPGGPQRTDTPAGRAGEPGAPAAQQENAESSSDQPSDSAG